MATDNFAVDYNDERFVQNEAEKNDAIKAAETTYGGMIDSAEGYYQALADNTKQYAEQQQQLQQEQTDLAIEQIEQQKEQTRKDYIKEQSGAYVDWQKQSNKYGVAAEQMAASGLAGTGYSESAQVSMYNTYQNRVATARESYNQAILNYDNNIAEARLQNSTILAEIAYNAQQEQLELALQGFQYKNSLVLDLFDTKQGINDTYYTREQDILNQINTENAMRQEQENWELEYSAEYGDGDYAIIDEDGDEEESKLTALGENDQKGIKEIYIRNGGGKSGELAVIEMLEANGIVIESESDMQILEELYDSIKLPDSFSKTYAESVEKGGFHANWLVDSVLRLNNLS